MKILCQRGDDTFLVENDSKYFLVDTGTKTKMEVDSPGVVYRQGYCEEAEITAKLVQDIEEIL